MIEQHPVFALKITGLAKQFDRPAVNDLNLAVQAGEFYALLGPNGAGKTTTLRMVAGLEQITSGAIRIGDDVVNDLPPRERDIAVRTVHQEQTDGYLTLIRLVVETERGSRSVAGTLFHERRPRIVEIRGNVDSIVPAPGEELLRLSPRRAFLFTIGDPVETVERVLDELGPRVAAFVG